MKKQVDGARVSGREWRLFKTLNDTFEVWCEDTWVTDIYRTKDLIFPWTNGDNVFYTVEAGFRFTYEQCT